TAYPGSLQGLLGPPFADLLMIAGEQDLGNLEALELRRTSVMGILKHAVAEGVVVGRVIGPEDSRHQPGDHPDQHHGGQLSPAPSPSLLRRACHPPGGGGRRPNPSGRGPKSRSGRIRRLCPAPRRRGAPGTGLGTALRRRTSSGGPHLTTSSSGRSTTIRPPS